MNDNFVIISAFRAHHDQKSNLLAHYELHKALHTACDVAPTLTLGKYKGNVELSYLVDLRRNARLYGTVLDMAQHFLQESVLRVVSGRASLVSQHRGTDHDTTRVTPIGQWTEVHPEYALKQEAYSRVHDKYYICKGNQHA